MIFPLKLEGVPTVCASLKEALAALNEDRDFLTSGDVMTNDQMAVY